MTHLVEQFEGEAERDIAAMREAALRARDTHARAELMRHMLMTAGKVKDQPPDRRGALHRRSLAGSLASRSRVLAARGGDGGLCGGVSFATRTRRRTRMTARCARPARRSRMPLPKQACRSPTRWHGARCARMAGGHRCGRRRRDEADRTATGPASPSGSTAAYRNASDVREQTIAIDPDTISTWRARRTRRTPRRSRTSIPRWQASTRVRRSRRPCRTAPVESSTA